ncbi:hypothetical protein ACF0H5_005410 [Mactra antiquata]
MQYKLLKAPPPPMLNGILNILQIEGHECSTEKKDEGETNKLENDEKLTEPNKSNRESNKENQRPDTGFTTDSQVHSDEEPELQKLVTKTTDQSDTGNQKSLSDNKKPADDRTTPRMTNSSLKINIPQVEIMDSEDEKNTKKGRPPVIKGRQPFMSGRSTLKTGKLTVQSRNRPFSAMDAYRYILDHPRKSLGGSDVFNTSYQQQRTEAWRQSASTSASNPQTPRQGTPPPQRPTSPDQKVRPNSALSVTRANDWLAGGRDLYWESMQKRPRSGHIPGWKEGLPDSMKRPRSAVAARTLNRQTRKSHPVTPSSLAYEAMMQGDSKPSQAATST